MRTHRRLTAALGALLAGVPAWAQERVTLTQVCAPPPAAAPVRFRSDAAGTVTDLKSGLTWMRCALGQQWNGTDCSGVPLKPSWAGAFDRATELNRRGGYGGHTDWRLPALDELASLVEPRCYDPALDLASFPSSPITGFWSATPHASGNHAMLVHFKYGGSYMGNRDQTWALRLVRD